MVIAEAKVKFKTYWQEISDNPKLYKGICEDRICPVCDLYDPDCITFIKPMLSECSMCMVLWPHGHCLTLGIGMVLMFDQQLLNNNIVAASRIAAQIAELPWRTLHR